MVLCHRFAPPRLRPYAMWACRRGKLSDTLIDVMHCTAPPPRRRRREATSSDSSGAQYVRWMAVALIERDARDLTCLKTIHHCPEEEEESRTLRN